MIKLSDPSISKQAIERATAVLQSGNLVQGETVRAFEQALETYLSVAQAVIVSSGTAALHLSLKALDIGSGDEVIVPAFSFPATANAVELVGAKPVFVDINLDDMCIDAAAIDKAITSRTKAVMPVHEFGQPADWESIERIANKHRLLVVEDAACALGAAYGGKKIGSLGTVGCFSFHPRKTVTTGEGGCIVTSSQETAQLLRSLRNHGMVQSNGTTDFEMPGFNYRLTEFQAALGIEQFERLDSLIAHRREIASVYDTEFSGEPIEAPKQLSNRFATYQTYHVLLPERVDRAAVIAKLKTHGIESNLGAHAIHSQSFYATKYSLSPKDFPNALKAYRHGLALPMGPHVDTAIARQIALQLKNVLKECL